MKQFSSIRFGGVGTGRSCPGGMLPVRSLSKLLAWPNAQGRAEEQSAVATRNARIVLARKEYVDFAKLPYSWRERTILAFLVATALCSSAVPCASGQANNFESDLTGSMPPG